MHISENGEQASITPFFTKNITALWSSIVYVMFSFGGIAVMGIVANDTFP
ncbi:hypothetical protein [Jeotgalibacillus marinus]|uniref:Uncharacterized protein n=1 Tax=Jeotgalibacillus marinus TaxID=86667 RepID=A0ABV3Q5L9_9BACL